MKLKNYHSNYIIFFSALFLIFSFVLYKYIPDTPNNHQDIDSKAYISNAVNFYNYNSFSKSDDPKATPYYSLGYAFFLGIIYKFFGLNNFFVIWIQVLLALFIAFLIFKTTGYLFGKKVALLAFAFACFNLGFLVFSQFILTEILLLLFLTFFLERFVLFFKTKNFNNLYQSGFFLGLSILVKSAAIYFIFFIILFLLFFIKRKILNKIIVVAIFCLSFYLPVIGYMFFNKTFYGNFAIAPLANESLYFYFLPKVIAKKNNTDIATETRNLRSLLTGSKFSSDSWSKISKLFFEELKDSPVLFIKIWLKNVAKTCLGLFATNLKVLVEPSVRGGDISFFKTKGNLIIRFWNYIVGGTDSILIKSAGLVESLWIILRYILCFIAFIYLFIRKRWSELFLFGSYIFYFAMITGHDGCARFRMMFEPVLIILSAAGCWVFINWYKGLYE